MSGETIQSLRVPAAILLILGIGMFAGPVTQRAGLGACCVLLAAVAFSPAVSALVAGRLEWAFGALANLALVLSVEYSLFISKNGGAVFEWSEFRQTLDIRLAIYVSLMMVGGGVGYFVGEWRCAARRAPTETCASCDYDLRGSGGSRHCPECGAIIPQAIK